MNVKLGYKFNLKIQLVYGVIGFLTSLAVLFLVLNEVRRIPAIVVGIGNFLVSGFYTDYHGNL